MKSWLWLLLAPVLISGCAHRWHAALLEPLPSSDGPAVHATWLGTAGFLLSDGRTRLLIDPFVSRPRFLRVALQRRLCIEEGRIADWINRIGAQGTTAVLVSHSHYDHVMDAPAFAKHTGAVVVGSASTCNVAIGYGLAPGSRCVTVSPTEPTELTFGAFRVTFRPSRHGPVLFDRVPYPGTIDAPLVPPVSVSDYRVGAVYGLVIEHPLGTIVHHGSAAWLPDTYRDVKADVVLLGLTGRKDTAAYLEDVVEAVGAKRLVPMHFDNPFRALDEPSLDKPLHPLKRANVDEFFKVAGNRPEKLHIEVLPIGIPRVLLGRGR